MISISDILIVSQYTGFCLVLCAIGYGLWEYSEEICHSKWSKIITCFSIIFGILMLIIKDTILSSILSTLFIVLSSYCIYCWWKYFNHDESHETIRLRNFIISSYVLFIGFLLWYTISRTCLIMIPIIFAFMEFFEDLPKYIVKLLLLNKNRKNIWDWYHETNTDSITLTILTNIVMIYGVLLYKFSNQDYITCHIIRVIALLYPQFNYIFSETWKYHLIMTILYLGAVLYDFNNFNIIYFSGCLMLFYINTVYKSLSRKYFVSKISLVAGTFLIFVSFGIKKLI